MVSGYYKFIFVRQPHEEVSEIRKLLASRCNCKVSRMDKNIGLGP